MQSSIRPVLIVLFALLLILVPVAAQDHSDLPRFEPGECLFEVPGAYEVDCGYVVVPENWDAPDGNAIRVAVAIFRSQAENPAADPLIYLDGGPGGATLETANLTFGMLFAPFLAERDVILFDQRGVGFSEPSLYCDAFYTEYLDVLAQNISINEENDRLLGAMLQCADEFVEQGIDLTAYTSAQNAADVNALREVLGYEALNLLGVSYGSRLALTIMRDFPEAVRTSILGATYPPQVDLILSGPEGTRRVFDLLFADCAADDRCSAAYPDLEQVFYDTVSALDAEPATVSTVDITTGQTLSVVVNGSRFINTLFLTLYATDLIPLMPRTVYQVAEGNFGFFPILLAVPITTEQIVSRGMYFSVQCHEEIPFIDPEAFEATLEIMPELRDYFESNELIVPFCETWPSGVADPVENEPVVSDIPTLIIAGSYDPITPPEWARSAAESLANHFYFELRNASHDASLANACARGLIRTFLADPETEPDGARVAQIGPPRFIAVRPR
jgi:pimeloyl-ACP methyl ester carboxylesterase